MQSNDQDVSNQELLETINAFANKVEQRFQGVDDRFQSIDERFQGVDDRFQSIERTLTTLVTKDYLDEKLGDLRGDMVVLMRKEDGKLRELVNILRKKNLLDDQDVKRLVTMEPFAQLSV